MNKRRHLLLVTALFTLASLAVIGTVSAEPPPTCLTTNLCFENAIKVTDFTGASDLAVGHINSNSNLDVVTTGWSRDKIRFKTGNGDGTFTGTWTKNMGDGTYEVDLADFNDDGYTDIIATNSEQDQVYIRWGLSGWNSATTWATDDHPQYVATGDLNNDGLEDFATGNTGNTNSITVRLRQAGGGFAPGTDYTIHHDNLRDVAFNDCDHDGDLDLIYPAVFDYPGEEEAFVYVRLNDGSGSFSAAGQIDMASEGNENFIGSIAFGDLNEDGWDDIVATRSDDKLIRVLGGMNCYFQDPIVADVQSDPYSLEIADMNGDGHLDVVVGHQYHQLITIHLGHGDGNMTGPYEPELTLDWSVRDIGVGDFNNDGLMDIAYVEESGVWLLLARESNSPPWVPPWLELNNMWFASAGQALVEIVLETVIISNVTYSGADGVDVLLDSAMHWSADIDLEGYLGSKLYLDTIANETVASSLGMISTQSGMEIWPVFNPTTYRIEYLLDDQVQLALTLPTNGQTPAAILHWDQNWCMMNAPPGQLADTCHMTLQTSVEHSVGYDQLIVTGDISLSPGSIGVTAANGNLVAADHIRLLEIPDGQGGPAENGFSRVEIRAAATETVAVNEIITVSAEPPPGPTFDWILYVPVIMR